jgi:plasmid stabilization system protein ParE
MTHTVVFAATASAQLEAIKEYIAAAADAATAERYVDAVINHCLDLEMFPQRGMRRDDLRPGLRIMNYRKRVSIAFLVDDDAPLVTIIGVLYGGQDLDAAFGTSGSVGDAVD